MAMPLCLRQRGRIINTVARHGYRASRLLQALHDLGFLFRQNFRFELIDAQIACATASAVARLSPVSITKRKPSALRSRKGLRRRRL